MFRSFRDFVPETLCLGRVTRFWTHITLIVTHIVSHFFCHIELFRVQCEC